RGYLSVALTAHCTVFDLLWSFNSYNQRATLTEGPASLMYAPFFRGSKTAILFRAGILIAVIAVLDWRTVDEIPLRILYLLPMLMVGNVLEPLPLMAVATLCTWLSES